MAKKNNRKNRSAATRYSAGMQAVTFGEPETVSYWGNYSGLYLDTVSGYYIPPVERSDLVKLSNMCAYHGAILRARVNMITSGYIRGCLTRELVQQAVFNFLLFGDVGILKIRNRLGKINSLMVLPSLYLRRNAENETFIIQQTGEDLKYSENDVIFISQYDPQQQIYGVPDYLHGMESAMLNTDATKFRRRYFKNGAHMGYILYTSDPGLDAELEKTIRHEIANSQGAGNFKSMFINIPGAAKDAVQVIPIGTTGTRDEFLHIKNVSAQDQLVAHRFPPGLAGIIPENNGGFGDTEKIRHAYYQDEVIPLRRYITDCINQDREVCASGAVEFDLNSGFNDSAGN